jgi:Zn finger protein HypA/HybF involved in hydrogenase expression
VKDTELEPLALDLELIPRVQRCSKCAYEFRMTDFDPRCPLCGEFATECISGEELDIAYMEVEDS